MKQNLISGKVAGALVALSGLLLLALILLYAFADDLRSDATVDANALSRSAVGFAGLAELLPLAGISVQIDRGPQGRAPGAPSLTILTPPAGLSARDLGAYRAQGPLLIILPKWASAPLRNHPGWAAKVYLFDPKAMAQQLMLVAGSVTVLRTNGDARDIQIVGQNELSTLPAVRLNHIETLQHIGGVEPLLSARDYGPVLARSGFKTRWPVYILAEPDLFNNQGLADAANARLALAVIAALRAGVGPVRFDVTLNGFGHAQSLLRAFFLPPFLGATITALLVALLMGLHAAIRFGAPVRDRQLFARGKKALADNSAALVRLMGREGRMAPRYVASARGLVLEHLGARRLNTQAQDELLAVLERGAPASFTELMREADQAHDGADLAAVAHKTWNWRRRISGGH